MIASLFSFLIHDFLFFWLFYLRINEKSKVRIKCTKKKAERGTTADSKQKIRLFSKALDCRFCGTLAVDSITVVICQIKGS